MVITKGPTSKASRAFSIGFSSLSLASKCLRYLPSSLGVNYSGRVGNNGITGNGVLPGSELTRVLPAGHLKSVERTEHLSSILAYSHLSKKPVTDKVFSGSKSNKVITVVSAAHAFRNYMMSFSVASRKVSRTMIDNLVVPFGIFVRKERTHMFIYHKPKTTCMKRA
jgi:hypothetical protein